MAPPPSKAVGSISMPRPSVTYAVPHAICRSSAGSKARTAGPRPRRRVDRAAPRSRKLGLCLSSSRYEPDPANEVDRLRKTPKVGDHRLHIQHGAGLGAQASQHSVTVSPQAENRRWRGCTPHPAEASGRARTSTPRIRWPAAGADRSGPLRRRRGRLAVRRQSRARGPLRSWRPRKGYLHQRVLRRLDLEQLSVRDRAGRKVGLEVRVADQSDIGPQDVPARLRDHADPAGADRPRGASGNFIEVTTRLVMDSARRRYLRPAPPSPASSRTRSGLTGSIRVLTSRPPAGVFTRSATASALPPRPRPRRSGRPLPGC